MARIASPAANGSPVASRDSPTPSSGKESPFVERSNPMGSGIAQTVSSRDPKAVAQAATDLKNVVRRKLTGYVGFANLPNQWHRKSVRKGFNFNVMVVGMLSLSIAPGKPGQQQNLTALQVNPAWESRPSSTPCLTPPSTRPRSPPAPMPTSYPRPCRSSRPALISRRTASASA